MARPPRKKKDIERSALELFVEKGVDGTSIRDIAHRAGVTEGALYRHHKSKDDLVRALFFEHFAGFADLIAENKMEGRPFRETLPRMVESFFEFYDRDRYVFHFVMLVRHKLLEDVRADDRNPVELLQRLIQRAMDSGEIGAEDAALTTQLMLGMVMQVPVAAHYGRIQRPLLPYVGPVSQACLRICNAS